jgi:hypothetical protein
MVKKKTWDKNLNEMDADEFLSLIKLVNYEIDQIVKNKNGYQNTPRFNLYTGLKTAISEKLDERIKIIMKRELN